jgi:hypothetical protein
MNLKLALAAPLLLALGAAPAHADLSMVGRSTVEAMGMQGVGQEGLWLKHTRIRRDLIDRGKAYSHIYNLDTREITVINHSLRQADVFPMKALSREADAKVASKDVKLEITPTGQTRPLQKWTCEEYKLHISIPAEVGGEKLALDMDGDVWIAKGTKEQEETAAFVKAARSPDLFMGVPAMAKASPEQARGISEAFRRVAPMGLLCSLDVNLKYEGSGRMAELSRKMASRISVVYDRYGTAPLKDEYFEIPPGYRVIRH